MDNLRGIALMIGAMALFAITDTFVKIASRDIPVGQILLLMGLGGSAIFAGLTKAQGHKVVERDFFAPGVLLRNLTEIIGTAGFVTALSLIDITTASAVMQASPLAVTFGAVILLGETVGWRRWAAIFAGLVGVLVILRPGFDGFEPQALWAVVGMLGLGMRDLSTRMVPRAMPTLRLATYGMSMLIPTGLILIALGQTPAPMTPVLWGLITAAILFGVSGYYAITAAMRAGDVSVVSPFRYSRILFALVIGVFVFSERPDAFTLAGAALTVVAGLYAFLRENRQTHQKS